MVSIIHDGGSHSAASRPARDDVRFYTVCYKHILFRCLNSLYFVLNPEAQPETILTHLFGLFWLLPLLIFPLLGLFCFVSPFFLLGAAVTFGLYRPPGFSLWWLKVDPSIGCPIRIFTRRVTEVEKGAWLGGW